MTKTDLVNPLLGTRSDREFSRGSTLPLVQRPWAMTAWCPVTSDDPGLFHPDLPRLRGLRATSQSRSDFGDANPSPGQGFTLCPQTGPLVLDPERRASAYRLKAAFLSPYRFTTEFLRYRVGVDVAPTERCAVVRFTFGDRGARLIVEGPQARWTWDPARAELVGQTPVGAGPQGFLLVTFDRPVATFGSEGSQAWVEFEGGRGLVVEARVATSRLGVAPARVSRDRELGEKTLETVAEEGALAWEGVLGRFEVEGVPAERQVAFYTGLYRCLCAPRRVFEWDETGQKVGPLVEDPALAASYRTLYPLYALAYRDELPNILEGWAQAATVSPGRHPELASVFAEAVSKGITVDPSAWDALAAASGDSLRQRGFLPEGQVPHSVSATLERAYLDWCLAQWGHTLGHGPESRALEDSSRSWQNLFDLSMGFFRPKNGDGSWTDGFSPLAWNGPFAEGSAWQGGWSVPHDPEGLIAALGGTEVALARLDTLLALKPLYSAAGGEVQGMTQMALADFGQYAHSLPTAHGALWHYALVGRPDKTERLTRRVLQELYGSDVDGLCGPEAVALSAWYVWASLGLYPLCPGTPHYLLGSPQFPKVKVNSGDGRSFVIETKGSGPVVKRRTLAHLTLHEPRITQAELFDLGLLVCDMAE